MQPKKTTQEWSGWLKAFEFMLLLIGLLAVTYHTPRSAAYFIMTPRNPEIVRSDWRPAELDEDSNQDSNSPQGYDAAISIPITTTQPSEDPVVLNFVQVPQELVRTAPRVIPDLQLEDFI